ncbi:methionine aminopeptidase 1D, mitochondrial-like [Ornithodoros turicata]|uniref:methionine aminopeptidase 1D, mitochondrial-like n=1 Tax=Ornithodoros turicata TaxID=34597 RepID=UPI00313877D2
MSSRLARKSESLVVGIYRTTLLKDSRTKSSSSVHRRSITNITREDHYKRLGGRKPASFDVISRTGIVSPMQYVPDNVPKPEYASSGIVLDVPKQMERKSPDEILRTKDACRLARNILDEVSRHVKVGITTDEIDKITHSLCIDKTAYPSPLNYRWFPKSVCTSVNNVACHGIPDDRPLKDGDIISIDISVFYNGYHGDCAETYAVGDVDRRGKNLITIARESLHAAISICGPGVKLCEIGKKISAVTADGGYSVVPSFCGHGIGTYFHGPPDIYHFDNDLEGEMFEGLVFTIEPVISEGGPDIVILEDGWTAVTLDNSRAAQFEHAICITSNGADILTTS